MKNILFVIVRIYRNQFKRNYLIVESLQPLSRLISNFGHSETNYVLTTYVFPKLQNAKDAVKQKFKKLHLDTQYVKGSQTLPKSALQIFYNISHHSEGNRVGK